jgi:glycosyltransferase involved in cell wall biosynthesis
MQVVLTLQPGGTERLVLEIVRRLRDELPMTVCCLDDEGSWADQLRDEGISVTALRRRAGFRPALGRAIAALAAEHGTSVLHCHHYSPFVYGCVARVWQPRLQVVFTEHGRLSDALPSPKRRFANRMLSQIPHEVFAVSGDLKRHMVGEGFPSKQVKVLHNGIDIGPLPDDRMRSCVRQKLGISSETFVIGTIARLDPVKDFDTLIKATATLTSRVPALLLVIGDGPERGRLESLAGIDVRFLGHRDDARTLLAGCDVYANSSIHEGISLTILEAMAAGLPVVATAVGGTPEILDENCGRLIPARQPAALAEALHVLSLDRGLRRAMAMEGRKRVEAQFTIERMVGEYRDAYLRAAA